MSRDYRFRLSGMIFFVVMLSHFIFSNPGIKFINHVFEYSDNQDVIKILLSVAIPIFSSDAIGYIFSSIVFFVFNFFYGGYSKLYDIKDKYLKNKIDSLYKDAMISYEKIDNCNEFEKNFHKRFEKYNTEQKLIYLLWHTKEGVNSELQQWIERRFNAFFAAYSFFTAILFANIFSVVLIIILQASTSHLHGYNHFINGLLIFSLYCYYPFTYFNYALFIISILISVILIWNGYSAIKDAQSITDMHIAKYFNPIFKDLVNKIQLKYKEEITPKIDNPQI